MLKLVKIPFVTKFTHSSLAKMRLDGQVESSCTELVVPSIESGTIAILLAICVTLVWDVWISHGWLSQIWVDWLNAGGRRGCCGDAKLFRLERQFCLVRN